MLRGIHQATERIRRKGYGIKDKDWEFVENEYV
jgi:hypothetical protein